MVGVPVHWTGILDWTTGLKIYPQNLIPAQLHPPKAIASPNLAVPISGAPGH